MKTDYIIGIDPGKKGGIFLISPKGFIAHQFPVIKGRRVKKREKDEEGKRKIKQLKDTPDWEGIRDLFFRLYSGADHAFIERVSGGQSFGRAQSGSFNFGEHYGFMSGLVLAARIPLTRVSASVWKGHYGLKDKTDKTGSRTLAAKLLPSPDIRYDRIKDDGVAEAGLIALYGKQIILNGDDI